jgi:hypothetical protein
MDAQVIERAKVGRSGNAGEGKRSQTGDVVGHFGPGCAKGRLFFFEKKNQKTFAIWRTWPGERIHHIAKVFCFFSSEKKGLLP